MMGEMTNNTKLGTFVIVAVMLFTVAVYYIGNQQNLFGEKIMISAIFQNINGLQKGNNVRYSGINVGNIDDIIIVNDSMIQVNMMLNIEIQKFLKKNAVASIGSDGLVGNMIVNITPGRGNALPVVDQDVIVSYSRIETKDMLGTLGKTTENIELLSLNLLELSEKMLYGDGSISSLINDRALSNNLTATIQNLKLTSEDLRVLTNDFENSITASIHNGDGALGYLLTDSLLERQIGNIFSKTDTIIDTKMNPVLDNLNEFSFVILESSKKLQSIIDSLNMNEGMVGAMLKDEKIAQDIKESMHNINLGTSNFNSNMEALKHNILFRGYFRKLERKERRAIREKQNDQDTIK